MSNGFAHLGLATHDMAATIVFYETLLGFRRVADIQNHVHGGGVVRMVYFECSEEQFLVFMECKGVENIPSDFDTGINEFSQIGPVFEIPRSSVNLMDNDAVCSPAFQ